MKKNILFINPNVDEKSQNDKIKSVVYKTFPTSLAVLSGSLNAAGFKAIKIIDEQLGVIDDNDLVTIISEMSKPKIVGLSVLTLNAGRAYEISQLIKSIDGSVTIIFGGIHPTVAENEVFDSGVVDIVVRGEGEQTIIDIVQNIHKNIPLDNILGISYLDPTTKQVKVNPARTLINNLDEIPPVPFHLFEDVLNQYPSFATVLGSRGCPYTCSFCSSRSISGQKYRFHSVERVLNELDTLINHYKQDFIYFMDDNLSVNKAHFKELCQGIIDAGLHNKAAFTGSMRADDATEKVLSMAKKANFNTIYFGMETGSERLIHIIDKGETVKETIEGLRRAEKIGIDIGVTIIFGLPTETRKDRYETIRLIKSLPIADVRYNILSPYPGTPVYFQLNPQNKILIKENWSNFGVQYMWESDDIPYVPDESDRVELIWDTMYANLSYFLTPKIIWKLLSRPLAAGKVISLKKSWYLSFTELYKFGSLALFLLTRFSNVTIRMLWRSFLKKKEH